MGGLSVLSMKVFWRRECARVLKTQTTSRSPQPRFSCPFVPDVITGARKWMCGKMSPAARIVFSETLIVRGINMVAGIGGKVGVTVKADACSVCHCRTLTAQIIVKATNAVRQYPPFMLGFNNAL